MPRWVGSDSILHRDVLVVFLFHVVIDCLGIFVY